MPINYKNYPKNWKQIRNRILIRAGGDIDNSVINSKCEFCGILNYTPINPEKKNSKVVLTIAHLNHNIKDNRDENLKALCQRCHNGYDKDYRKQNRFKKKMETNQPSYYKFLDKSSKLLNNLHRNDIDIKFEFLLGGSGMSIKEYEEQKRNRKEYDRILNAKFLEARETKLYKLYSRIIKRAKFRKAMYSDTICLMRERIAQPMGLSNSGIEKIKERIDERLKWVKSYKSVIKSYRKKRADLIKGIDPYVMPKSKIITYMMSNYDPNKEIDNDIILSLEDDSLDCYCKPIKSNEKWVICVSNYFDKWGFGNNLEVFETFTEFSKKRGFSLHYREITMSKVKEKYPTDKFDYFYSEDGLVFWIKEKVKLDRGFIEVKTIEQIYGL